MEQIEDISVVKKLNWLDKRLRTIVHSIFAQLSGSQLEVIEGDSHLIFPSIANVPSLKGKIHIHDLSVYRDFVKGGSLGAAQAYIEGKWSSPNLTDVIRIFAKAQQQTDALETSKSWSNKIHHAISHWQNRNTRSGSKRNILSHYDLGNDLYTRFLDPEMMYSSAIYPTDDATLIQAQRFKLEIICQRLELKSSDHLLEIGTGWGGLAIYAAQHYGCQITTTTISNAQYDYAKQRIEKLGLTEKITLLNEDYRALSGHFDKVVSIEMIEAVGYEFLPSFFQQCNDRLKSDGKLLIQAITIADQRFNYYKNNVDFIQRYIFPGGLLPSINVLIQHMTDHSQLVMEKLDDIGMDYARTLGDWRSNFLKAWSELTTFGYDESFKRLWLYYFAYCEAAFLERATSTIQLVARK